MRIMCVRHDHEELLYGKTSNEMEEFLGLVHMNESMCVT